MSEKTNLTKRAARLAVFTVGGGVALTFAMANAASADDVTVQDANVTNAGAAAANSGGNIAVGNASHNTAHNDQTATGLIASNNGTATNSSTGTATITTGQATATGSEAATSVDQSTQGDGGPGLDVAVQDADVINAGVAASNSGGNIAVGNASRNRARNDQDATGAVASNIGGASNTSDGSATITTGAATATGNKSVTGVKQSATDTGAPGPGLGLVVQTSDVLNLGAAAANSGGNIGIGNASRNRARNDQDATGLFASNNGSASNKSDGKATITTGAATATGNQSATNVDQAAKAAGGPGLSLVFQDSDVLNLGVAAANTGGNIGIGNLSRNRAVNDQDAFGLLGGSNVGGASNESHGTSSIATGAATATGNQSVTGVKQGADPGPGGLNVVVQHAPVINAGLGVANTGLNIGVANFSHNTEILAQVSFGLLASNVGTSSNLSDGFTLVLTGAATGVGNQSATTVEQDA